MDATQWSLIIIPPICGAIGYILKTICENYSEKIKLKKKHKMEGIEFKLTHFYFPLFSNLSRENSIWTKLVCINEQHENLVENCNAYIFGEHFIDNNSSISQVIEDTDYENQYMMIELDKEILNIHLENQKIIKTYMIQMNVKEDLKKALQKYDEHVTIFNILRIIKPHVKKMKDMKYPKQFDACYPRELNQLLKREYDLLIQEYDDYESSIL